MEKKKILVVDDEPGIALMVKARLEEDGYVVDVAYSGEDGLEQFREQKPDLVVLDVMLPRLNGYQVCAVLKEKMASRTPVIMLTSRVQAIDERLGFMCKADAYVRKPFFGDRLLPEVKRLLKKEFLERNNGEGVENG